MIRYNIYITFINGTTKDYLTKGYSLKSDWLILYMLSGCETNIAINQIREFSVEEVA
jgi:hypothetical protein